MTSEDEAIRLIQDINKQMKQVINEIKLARKDSRELSPEDTAKLNQINTNVQQFRREMKSFFDRYKKQSSLQDF